MSRFGLIVLSVAGVVGAAILVASGHWTAVPAPRVGDDVAAPHGEIAETVARDDAARSSVIETRPVAPVKAVTPGTGLSQTELARIDWSVPARYRGKIVSKKPTGIKEKYVALTFDDGPDPKHTVAVLNLLKQYGAKGTFFVCGYRVRQHPEILRRMVAEGHEIGNHTMSHKAKPAASLAAREIDETTELIKRASGKYPTLFRPPYGIRDASTTRYALQKGFPAVIWTVGSADTSTKDDGRIYMAVFEQLRPGGIVLFHDTSDHSVKAIGRTLKTLKRTGWEMITTSDLLERWDAAERSAGR